MHKTQLEFLFVKSAGCCSSLQTFFKSLQMILQVLEQRYYT